MSHRITLWDYIFLARPILLVPVWAFFLIGYFKAGGNRFNFNSTFLMTIIAYTALMAILYILNQIADSKSDTINQKHLLIAEGIISTKSALIEISVLTIIFVLLCTNLPIIMVLFMIISLILGIIYSFAPFKLKGVGFADFLINGIGYGFVNFSLGWLTVNKISELMITTSLPYIFAVSAIFVNTTILDIEGDKKCGYKTTGVLLGRVNSARLALLLIVVCIVLAVINFDYVCLVPALISLPLFFLAGLRGSEQYIKLSIRIGGPLLIIIVGLIFPYFLLLTLLIFVFLRIYYKKKFGIIYPNL